MVRRVTDTRRAIINLTLRCTFPHVFLGNTSQSILLEPSHARTRAGIARPIVTGITDAPSPIRYFAQPRALDGRL